MRENHDDLPEILDAYERDGFCFGVVGIGSNDEQKAFEFGVDLEGYRVLRRILQERPTKQTGIRTCRYYFVPSVRRLAEQGRIEFDIRIEDGREGRQFSFIGPQALVSNLMWFFELKGLNGTEHLKVVLPKRD